MKHIIQSQDFDIQYLERLFKDTELIENMQGTYDGEESLEKMLKRKRIFIIFYQSSMRTILTFEIASTLLGAHVFKTENAGVFSSAAKGETLEHTIRVLCEYKADVIILRHNDEGAAQRAVRVVEKNGFKTHIINAGDGVGQHPTQSLVDLFSIRKMLGRLNEITVAIGGDLEHGRTTHSLAYLLSRYNKVKLLFVSPPQMKMKKGVLDHLREHGVPFEETDSVPRAFKEADIVYWIRVQKEYLDGQANEQYSRDFIVTEDHVNMMPENSILLHPMPIDGEIAKDIEDLPRVRFFKQASYGIAVRMALLCNMFDVKL